MSDEDESDFPELAAECREVKRRLEVVLAIYFEGNCPNPISANHDTVRALLAAYLEAFGEGYNAETFMDFVATGIAREGGWDHNDGVAMLYERRARERRMQFKPSAAAAKGWETRRRNQKDRDKAKG